jgi:hypothetical protein
MLVAFDVHYFEQSAAAACVGFQSPEDATPAFHKRVIFQGAPKAYEPGNFRERELPYDQAELMRLLAVAYQSAAEGREVRMDEAPPVATERP